MIIYLLLLGVLIVVMAAIGALIKPGTFNIPSRFAAAKLLLLATIGVALVALFVFWPRCVVEGSMVDTPQGPRPIESLAAGEKVWSRTAAGEITVGTVVAIERHLVFWFLRLTFTDGRRLEVTPSHPFATESGWKKAGALSPAEWVNGRFEALRVSKSQTLIEPTIVYDITVHPHANFFANGILVHNKSPFRGDSQAIGDTRSVISAMHTFASANCGFFPRDLTDATFEDGTPISIPNYPTNAPSFLGGDLGRPGPYAKSGYEREYTPFGTPDDIPPECAPDSVLAYCYTSHPGEHLLPTSWFDHRYRSFVATSNGAIYFDAQGRDLSCVDGQPPPYAVPLE